MWDSMVIILLLGIFVQSNLFIISVSILLISMFIVWRRPSLCRCVFNVAPHHHCGKHCAHYSRLSRLTKQLAINAPPVFLQESRNLKDIRSTMEKGHVLLQEKEQRLQELENSLLEEVDFYRKKSSSLYEQLLVHGSDIRHPLPYPRIKNHMLSSENYCVLYAILPCPCGSYHYYHLGGAVAIHHDAQQHYSVIQTVHSHICGR